MQSHEDRVEAELRGMVPVLQIGAAIGGAVLAWLGFQDLRLTAASEETPQRITCRALAEHGPGDNAHIELTDFLLVTGSFAVEQTVFRDEDGKPSKLSQMLNKDSWSDAWIPAVPPDSDYGRRLHAAGEDDEVEPPRDLRVLVQTGHGYVKGLDALQRRPVLAGTVVNVVESLHPGIDRILRDAYPGVDMGRCWILELDRRPEAPKAGWLKLLGGLALIGGAVAWFVWLRREGARAAASKSRIVARQKERRRLRRERSGGAGSR